MSVDRPRIPTGQLRSLLLALITCVALTPAGVLAQNGATASLLETAVLGSPTGVGAVEVIIAPGFSGVGYANVVIDLDGDGLEPSTDDWWVQNFPIVPDPLASPIGQVAFTFDISSLAVAGTYDVYASFGSSPVASPSLGSMMLTSAVPFALYDIGDLQDGTTSGLDGSFSSQSSSDAPPTESGPATWLRLRQSLDDLFEWLVRRAGAQMLIGRTRLDIPGILQCKNECAPTSALQSLLWLQSRQGLQGLPAQATLLAQLKQGMTPGDPNNPYACGNYPGIDPSDFVPGKDEVVGIHRLPIVTTAGGAFNGTGTFTFIKEQIEANEDVEMRIQYHPIPKGGHWVTIAGWYDDGTTKKLCFKDPLTGGGTVDCYTINGTTITDYKYGNPATISFAVKESIVNHYACYQTKDLKIPAKLPKGQTGTYSTQNDSGTYEKCKLKLLCMPVNKDGSGIPDPNLHYCCHQCKGFKGAVNYDVSDQFVTGRVQAKKFKFLCNPCDKIPAP